MQIQTIAESIQDTGTNIVVYGPAGIGKTSLAKTLNGNVLILSAESGLLSLASIGNDKRFGVKAVSTTEDMGQAYQYIADGNHDFDWVVLDSFSEICEVFLADEMQKTKDPRKAYGEVINMGTSLARGFRDLPVNTLFTCKEEGEKDESTGRVLVGPSMPGKKLKQAVPFLFDEVFRMIIAEDPEKQEKTRWLQTQPDVKTVAKDRSGMLDEYELADIGHIVDKIHNTNNAQGGNND